MRLLSAWGLCAEAEELSWLWCRAKVPQEKMIQPEDIAEAAMLPFRLSDRAVPTQIVVRPSQKVE